MSPDSDHRIIAILRGLTPDEAPAVVSALLDAGVRAIEIPLNSPDPFASIARAAAIAPADALIGAGTVLSEQEVAQVQAASGNFVVSPNTNAAVIAETKKRGMLSFPGVLTPTEAFSALAAGADGLKLFPAFLYGPAGISAIRAVLKPNTKLYAVGGVDEGNMTAYADAGADGFGIGSSLYKPGMTPKDVAKKAERFMQVARQVSYRAIR